MRTTTRRLGVALAACAVLVAACSSSTTPGGGSSSAPPKQEPLSALGNGEGQLNLIAWAGYADFFSLLAGTAILAWLWRIAALADRGEAPRSSRRPVPTPQRSPI